MKEVNIDTWNRKEHFRFFGGTAYPVYNITFNLDVTKLLAFARREGLSFNLSLIYLSTKALNSIENFRYRLRGEKVVLHESLTPSFADIEAGSELFKMVTVDMDEDLVAFEKRAREKARAQTRYFVPEEFAGRDDFVFYSALPWISFTSVDHTANLKREDAIERISFGKYFADGERVLLPYNIQVNHLFVDGIHLGKFKDALDGLIDALD